MAVMRAVGAPKSRPPARTLHFTRQELKEYIDRSEIFAVEKITKVFGGLPCRTVKVFPLPDDFVPKTMEEFFSDVSGHVVATLTFTDYNVRTMFVSFSFAESVQLALNKSGQSIGSSPNEFEAHVQVLPDAEFLKFLQAIVIESRFFLYGEKKRRFEHPDSRGTTLSEELDIYLSVLRSTLHREKRRADEEENAKQGAFIAGFEEPPKDECSCEKLRKRNKVEIAYDNKKVQEFDHAVHLPKIILPQPNMIQRLMKRKKTPSFGYFTLGAFVVTAVVGCYLFHRTSNRIGRVGVLTEPINCMQ